MSYSYSIKKKLHISVKWKFYQFDNIFEHSRNIISLPLSLQLITVIVDLVTLEFRFKLSISYANVLHSLRYDICVHMWNELRRRRVVSVRSQCVVLAAWQPSIGTIVSVAETRRRPGGHCQPDTISVRLMKTQQTEITFSQLKYLGVTSNSSTPIELLFC